MPALTFIETVRANTGILSLLARGERRGGEGALWILESIGLE
jgi:hypothetical protein